MAVDENVQGKGVGQALLDAAIAKAADMGLDKLVLYSNTKLEPAIHLYKKYGFTEVPLDSTSYKRSNIKMEKSL
jgi:ribosomal protein S18 acetylase RimI-like enzyme